MVDYALFQGTVCFDSLSLGWKDVSVKDLSQHGLFGQAMKRVKEWRSVAAALTPEQRQKFNVGRKLNNYYATPYVYVPEDHGKEWAVYPVAVLNTGNQDSIWYYGQENGPIEPWRFVKPNEEHVWENPFPGQPLRVILHVLPGTDYQNPENYDLQPKAQDMKQVGDTRFSDEGDGLRMSIKNPLNRQMRNEEHLPLVDDRFPRDWSSHRPVGMFLDGDGRNEVLVLQIHAGMARDYAVPVDFTGRRYIEIPNGEAAYAISKWGWRFDSGKYADYSKIGELDLGFGELPSVRLIPGGMIWAP